MSSSRIVAIVHSVGFGVVCLLFFVAAIPAEVPAQEGNAIYCTGTICPCDMGPGPKCPGGCCAKVPRPAGGVVGCFCQEIENGRPTTGTCASPLHCEAKSTSAGKSPMDASKLMEALKGLMDALKGKGGGGGGGAPPANTDPCAALSSVTRDANAAVLINPTNSSTSPCVNGQFTPLLSDQLGSLNQGTGGGGLGDALLRALGATGSGSSFDSGSGEEDAGGGEEESSNVSDILGGVSGDAEDADAKEGDAESTNAADKKGAKATIIKGGVVSLEPSTEGDIYIGEGGAMIFARSRDPKSNTEVAGFYGGSTGSESASKGLIGRLCTTRPWSAGFLSKVIPPSFFDGLCTRAGYQVGVVVTESGGAPAGKRTSAPAPQKQKTNPVNLPTVQPEVDIWAEPANVRLGTRTYIFWNTKGVVSCTVSGPSFTQSALSGGASTVPLSDASTFTLECKTAGDVVVTDSVRVNLAI